MLLYIIIQLQIILPIISGTVLPQVSFKSKNISLSNVIEIIVKYIRIQKFIKLIRRIILIITLINYLIIFHYLIYSLCIQKF